MKSFKTCSVPYCESNTIIYPKKLFIHVPKCTKRRKEWLELACRDPERTSDKSAIFFCEDHFDLPKDMENYIQYSVMGYVGTIRLRPNCLPSKFPTNRIKYNSPPQSLKVKNEIGSNPTASEFTSINGVLLTTEKDNCSNQDQLKQEEMSSKANKKATTTVPPPEPIVTRTKSAQRKRVLRNKNKKTEKPKLTKPETKPTKTNKSVIRSKEALLKPKNNSVEVVEQVEYYPDKLKRDICAKKIMLKPRHNFKVVAATNKRKLATPQKGIKSPTPPIKPATNRSVLKTVKRAETRVSSPQLSVQDMVRMMEETGSLCDEDFMEILTCPSPVWWEDPPDERYDEDSIITISPSPELEETSISETTPTNSHINTNKKPNSEQNIEQRIVNSEKFNNKKLKLESVLGNIKNKTIKKPNEIKETEIKINEFDRNRKLSDSEGDISDLSFNEDEILKNLENMEIPIEKPVNIKTEYNEIKKETDTDFEDLKEENTIVDENEIKKENELEILPTLTPKPNFKDEFSIKSSSDASLGDMNSNINKKDDTDIVGSSKFSISIKDTKSLLDVKHSSNTETINSSVNKQNSNIPNSSTDKNDTLPQKKSNDLSEYITIYKIIPEKNNGANNRQNEIKSTENNNNKTKIDASGGKLNDFFKQCKSNKRLKKNETLVPAVSVTAVKEETIDKEENVTELIGLEDENRLKNCDCCVRKTENGTSCEKCEMAPISPCNLCNFVADTTEVYKNHVSSCKDVARISWGHNYVLNQT